jgi:uncharacterized protein Veg
MRKRCQSIDTVKEKIRSLTGKDISMRVCRGRKRVTKYTGTIEHTFPCVFVVRIRPPADVPYISYSYSDVLCGEVIINEVV